MSIEDKAARIAALSEDAAPGLAALERLAGLLHDLDNVYLGRTDAVLAAAARDRLGAGAGLGTLQELARALD